MWDGWKKAGSALRYPASASVLLFATIGAQAWWTRELATRLPEPEGDRQGVVRAYQPVESHPLALHSAHICAGQHAQELFPPDRRLRLVFIGESTASGVGVDHPFQSLCSCTAQSLAEALASSSANVTVPRLKVANQTPLGSPMEVHWMYFALSGSSVLKTLRVTMPKLRHAMEELGQTFGDGSSRKDLVDVVVVVLGANDCFQMTSSRKFKARMKQLVVELKDACGPHTRVVLLGVPNIESFPGLPYPLNAFLGLRSRYMDTFMRQAAEETGSGYIDTFIPDGRTILCFDGFHPGELGYAAWGRFLADELMALLETQQEHMVQDQSVGPCPAVDHDQEQPGTC